MNYYHVFTHFNLFYFLFWEKIVDEVWRHKDLKIWWKQLWWKFCFYLLVKIIFIIVLVKRVKKVLCFFFGWKNSFQIFFGSVNCVGWKGEIRNIFWLCFFIWSKLESCFFRSWAFGFGSSEFGCRSGEFQCRCGGFGCKSSGLGCIVFSLCQFFWLKLIWNESTRLYGENYSNWKIKVLTVLEGNSLWPIVTGAKTKLTGVPTILDWEKRGKKSKVLLRMSVKDNIIPHIRF